MANCYSCGTALEGQKRSFEHIINNSIGGHDGSFDLLCKKCNEDFGSTIDSELGGQLGDIAALLNIKRDRASAEPVIEMISESGKVKKVGLGMKPHIKLSFPVEEKKISLFTTESKYEKLVRAKTRELSRKAEVTFVESTELPTKEKYFIKNRFYDGDGYRRFGGGTYALICR